MLAEKSVPYYFEPAPSVQYNGISHRLSEQCRDVQYVPLRCLRKWNYYGKRAIWCVIVPGKGGHFGHVFRIKPPMCITKEDAEMTAQVLEEAIAAVEATLSE
jgi:hypothetical protein